MTPERAYLALIIVFVIPLLILSKLAWPWLYQLRERGLSTGIEPMLFVLSALAVLAALGWAFLPWSSR
jgi:hypothetical protein